MQVATLLSHHSFELDTSGSLHFDVFFCDLGLSLPVGHLSSQSYLVLLQLCEVPLHVLAGHLQVIRQGAVTLDVVKELVLLVFSLIECLLSQLVLVSDMIDVAFERVDFLDARLLSLLYLSQSELSAVEFLLQILQLGVCVLRFLC